MNRFFLAFLFDMVISLGSIFLFTVSCILATSLKLISEENKSGLILIPIFIDQNEVVFVECICI